MTVPQKCDVCLTPHHKHQAHVFAKVAPVHIATLEYMRAGGTFVASVDPAIATRLCVVCGVNFYSKRRHAKTCSAKCRQRKRRAKA